jgi:hypothetical protein
MTWQAGIQLNMTWQAGIQLNDNSYKVNHLITGEH